MSNAIFSFSCGEVLPEFLNVLICLLRQTVFLAKSSAPCLIDMLHEGKRSCKLAELAVCYRKVVHGGQGVGVFLSPNLLAHLVHFFLEYHRIMEPGEIIVCVRKAYH